MADRNIIDVIDRMLAAIPPEESQHSVFVESLRNVRERAKYRAPELGPEYTRYCWYRLHEVVDDEFPFPGSLTREWHKDLIEILTTERPG